MTQYIAWFDQLTMHDVGLVGGKNASLGEMISHLSQAGVNVPAGFATTTKAYREFLVANGLVDRINHVLDGLDVDDINALITAGKTIRGWVLDATLPDTILQAVSEAYNKLVAGSGDDAVSFAVHSSATAEDIECALDGQLYIVQARSGGCRAIKSIHICHSERSEESLRKNSIDFSLCSK